AVCTSNPSSLGFSAMSSLITSSSSTTSTRPVSCVTGATLASRPASRGGTGAAGGQDRATHSAALLQLRPRSAPLAQGIEQRPPEPCAQVRILQGAPGTQRTTPTDPVSAGFFRGHPPRPRFPHGRRGRFRPDRRPPRTGSPPRQRIPRGGGRLLLGLLRLRGPPGGRGPGPGGGGGGPASRRPAPAERRGPGRGGRVPPRRPGPADYSGTPSQSLRVAGWGSVTTADSGWSKRIVGRVRGFHSAQPGSPEAAKRTQAACTVRASSSGGFSPTSGAARSRVRKTKGISTAWQ